MPTSARRLWTMRLAAVLLGMLPVLGLEWGLSALGIPQQPPPLDPFLDLHNLQPLFVTDPSTGNMSIGSERRHLFRPASFSPNKRTGTYRIFALGGSTTQGEPYSTETAFPEWLRLNLQAAHPEREFEVINCGGLSYASYRVLAILREILQYDPDLILIYTGQNEYLERRSYAGYHEASFRNRSSSFFSQLHTVQLVRQKLFSVDAGRRATLERTRLATEVDALLDYESGLADYHRDASWYEPVAAHFRWNIEQMVSSARAAAVPVVFIRPVTNLLDCPPFKFEVSPHLTAAEQSRFEQHWQAAKAATDVPRRALEDLEQALEIDPEHAGAQFLKGRMQYELADYAGALQSLTLARDFDVCPLRATSEILTALSQLADQQNLPLLDAEQLFADRSPHGIVGDQWLVDHIHPSIEGHQLLGEQLALLLFQSGLVSPPPSEYTAERDMLYAKYLAGLDESYFHRGKQRLEGLLLWTQGRAKKIRTESQP